MELNWSMSWAVDNRWEILRLSLEHVVMCAAALSIAVIIAIPLAVWAHGHERRSSWLTGIASVMFTIPSLALFALMVPIVGLGLIPAIIGLVIYAQLMLVRAALEGLDSVPSDVRDAASGMGLPRIVILREVEFPLAIPVFISGLRGAAVTLIGIATIGALIDAGGLGELILQGIQRSDPARVLTGSVCVAAIAIVTERGMRRLEQHTCGWRQPA
jgi:osmoprotectant transport system permease protein